MNMYLYRDIIILTTLATNLSLLIASQPAQQSTAPQHAGKFDYFHARRPSLELDAQIAIITATTTLADAAQALADTRARVTEKINAALAPAWLATLDETYSQHIGSFTFEFEKKQTSLNELFAAYKHLEQQLLALHAAMTQLGDEEKSDHLDTMLILIQQGKRIEDFMAQSLAANTIIERIWQELSSVVVPTMATITKTMADFIPTKASPTVQAAFTAQLDVLRTTKTLKAAQTSYYSTQTWLQQRLVAGDITPAEYSAWTTILDTTFNDQTVKRLPQLQISQMYAKAKAAIKSLKGYDTAMA